MANEFLPFGTAAGANVAALDDYAANSSYTIGYQAGVAQSKYLNRTWRQSSVVAAMIGQFISDRGGNALDNGSVLDLKNSFNAGLRSMLGSHSAIIGVSSSASLTAANAGQLISMNASITMTLPAANSVPSGTSFSFVSQVSPAFVAVKSGDRIFIGATILTAVPFGASDSMTVTSDGTDWYGDNGSAFLRYSQTFQRAIGGRSGIIGVTSSMTLTAANAGQLISISAPVTMILPLANSMASGSSIAFVSQSAGASVNRQASNAIIIGSSTLTSIPMGVGDSLVVTTDGTSWYADGGSALLRYSAQFLVNDAINGSARQPNGQIMKWGAALASTSGTTSVSFDSSFPTSLRSLICTVENPGPFFATHSNKTTGGFNFDTWNISGQRVNATINYIAIGN